MTVSDITNMFSKCGKIIDVRLLIDRGKFNGYEEKKYGRPSANIIIRGPRIN